MKKLKIIGGILAALGFALMIVGSIFAAVAGVDYISSDGRWPLRWSVFSEGNWGVSAGSDPYEVTKTASVEGVTILRLRADATEIELVPVSDTKITAEYCQKRGSRSFSLTESAGSITINAKQGVGTVNREAKLTLSVPASFLADATCQLELSLDACQLSADDLVCAASVRVDANACDIEMEGLSGALTVDLNAGKGEFAMSKVTAPISLKSAAAALTLKIPRNSNANVVVERELSSFENDFDLGRSGGRIGDGGHDIKFSGAVSGFKLEDWD